MVAALVLAGCGRGSGGDGGPRLIVAWTGADTGTMAAPVVAEWCDSLRALEIRGVRGDSGIAMVLYPREAIGADSFPVVAPERADTSRPAAAVGARWFAETSIKGFQADSGDVVLREAGARVSGRVRAGMRSVTDGARLELEGTFEGVPVVPAARECAPRPKAARPDSGVD